MSQKQAVTAVAIILFLVNIGLFATKADLAGSQAQANATFITKTDLKDILQPIMDRLQRIEQKLDRYMEK